MALNAQFIGRVYLRHNIVFSVVIGEDVVGGDVLADMIEWCVLK